MSANHTLHYISVGFTHCLQQRSRAVLAGNSAPHITLHLRGVDLPSTAEMEVTVSRQLRMHPIGRNYLLPITVKEGNVSGRLRMHSISARGTYEL